MRKNVRNSCKEKTNPSDPDTNSDLGQNRTHNPLQIHWFGPTHTQDPIIIANPTQRLQPSLAAQHLRSYVCLSHPQLLQPKTWQSMAKPNYLRPTYSSRTPTP